MFYKKELTTEEKIIDETAKILATSGDEGFNIRDLAKKVGIAPSVIYYHFENKEILLKKMFRAISKNLGIKRRLLPNTTDAVQLLKNRILFQFDNATEVVAVLKYYLYARNIFPKIKTGYIPDKAYLHIEEVLALGVKNKQFTIVDVKKDAKLIAHAINGFVLEYYPHIPEKEEKLKLVDEIHAFILRAVQSKVMVQR